MPNVSVGGQELRAVSLPAARLLESLPELDQVEAVVQGTLNGESGVVVLLTPSELVLVSRDVRRVPLSSINRFSVEQYTVKMWTSDEKLVLQASDEGLAAAFAQALNRLATIETLRHDRITTFDHLPGHTVTQVLGPVSVLCGASGLTATIKGNTALARATDQLREAALNLGANAVIGLSASAFGAGGGITSTFGGDAVGVLLLGTAVVVEPDRPENPSGVTQGSSRPE